MRISMRLLLPLLLIACNAGQGPAADLSLSSLSPRPWVDDLVCGGLDDAEITWFADDAPWTGATTRTDRDADTIPADAISQARTWTCVAADQTATATTFRPSVVLLVVDDLGFADVGAFGGVAAHTPRLDALAAQGVQLSAAYATAPVCGPSRAGLITGRQQNRFGFEYNIRPTTPGEPEDLGLPAHIPTIGDLMSDAGYATGFIGKWHLGKGSDHHPLERGFDHFFGFLNGQRLSMPPGLPGVLEAGVSTLERELWPASASGDQLLNGREPAVHDERHLTDRLTDEAIGWIDDQAGPFLLVLSYNAPHIPLQAPPEHLALLPDRPDDDTTAAYLATVAGLDAAIGRLLDHLDRTELGSDTLVAFVSDNGCPANNMPCDNTPYLGGKLLLTEGGLRVPAMIRWPGRLPTGVVDQRMVSTLDLAPTLLAAALAPPDPQLDGVDLVPALRGDAPVHDHLAWRMWPAFALREGDDKYVRVWNRRWLFDLSLDPELTDLSATQRARRDELEESMLGILEGFEQPAWRGDTYEESYYGVPTVVAF